MNHNEAIEAMQATIDDLRALIYGDLNKRIEALEARFTGDASLAAAQTRQAREVADLSVKITASRDGWKPKMTNGEVAELIGANDNHTTLINIGRALSGMGMQRGSNGSKRYYYMDQRKIS